MIIFGFSLLLMLMILLIEEVQLCEENFVKTNSAWKSIKENQDCTNGDYLWEAKEQIVRVRKCHLERFDRDFGLLYSTVRKGHKKRTKGQWRLLNFMNIYVPTYCCPPCSTWHGAWSPFWPGRGYAVNFWPGVVGHCFDVRPEGNKTGCLFVGHIYWFLMGSRVHN